MKAIMMTVRLWWFYLTYKGIKKIEIRKRFTKDFKGKIFECVSKTNWKKDLMKIPEEEREFFKQFVGKVGLCFECDKVDDYANGHKWSWEQGAPMWGACNDYEYILKDTCLTDDELREYVEDLSFSAIHITKLEIFDKSKELKEFTPRYEDRAGVYYGYPLSRAPQSFCFIEV